MENQKKFMREAIRLSIENVQSGNGGPFGTVIVKNGNIIASGVNKVTQSSDPTAHAEIVAIRSACETLGTFQLVGCEIYCSCEPCPMCLGAIYWARPDRIYFANTKEDAADINFDDNFIYNELDVSISQRKLPTTQLLRDEAQMAFTQWRESTAKTEY
ncbi:MAG: nucleoside deaminase [Candidatus Marinimicrobia bacterium]|jgi:tRNA(Arg) A34 adenosine deaminase TadA|nr:nucleoside deaminase [Candidatus Neomarinimicrobiota bacterium]